MLMTAGAEAKRHAAQIARRLAAAYPDAVCSLDFSSPSELLVATILSAQCTDVRVNQVTKMLFRKYPTAAHYARVALAELEQDIQPTGFFRNKAKNIQNCCKTLLEKCEGQVPKEMDKLVELPGVGRKTANVVLGTAFGIAVGIVVDTHVTRIARRLGLTTEKDAVKIERDLMDQFAAKEWIALSHRLIQHGRRCCTARKPNCGQCPLESLCPKIGV
jgi:endonuclease III